MINQIELCTTSDKDYLLQNLISGVTAVQILIDPSMMKTAIEHSEERLKFEYDRFRLSPEQRKSMILIGTLGQLIFKKFLEDNSISFDFEFQAGKYDKKDFMVNKSILEIKCSGYNDTFSHMNLFYAKDQFDSGCTKNFQYCVQIFINGYDKMTKLLDHKKCTNGIIIGYIEFPAISNFRNPTMKYFGDYYKVPLSSLKPIQKLLTTLQ